MNDTPNEVNARYRELLMRRSGAERLEMGCRMFDTARSLMRASLGDPSGADRSCKMLAQLFLRTYCAHFDSATGEPIAACLCTGGRPCLPRPESVVVCRGGAAL